MTRLARFSIFLRLLRVSLVAGALYDVGLALLLLVAPRWLSSFLHLPLPGESFYHGILAALLVGLAACYLYAFYDPDAYSGNVRIAIGVRALAGAVLLFHAVERDDLPVLFVLGAVELVFAAAHALFWWPVKR